MIQNDEKKRILISLKVINNIKLKVKISKNLISKLENIKFNNKMNSYKIENYTIEKKCYDNYLLDLFNFNNINDLLNCKKVNIFKIEISDFYSQKIKSPFVSLNIIRDIINNLNKKIIFNTDLRSIIIYYKNNFNKEIIYYIDSILNLFDKITNRKNRYTIEIYLSDKKKLINNNYNFFDCDNINSGATRARDFIILWRKEEIFKVLVHELVHYLQLDLFLYQNILQDNYLNINVTKNSTNPNEAFTELNAIILYQYWKFKIKKPNNDLENFINRSLTIELAWSLYQSAKILKFFKCYNSYKDLFTSNCSFNQTTSVLSYFFLKTYLLFNLHKIDIFLNFDGKQMSKKIVKELNNIIYLNDNYFATIIDKILFLINKENIINDSMRMSCLN